MLESCKRPFPFSTSVCVICVASFPSFQFDFLFTYFLFHWLTRFHNRTWVELAVPSLGFLLFVPPYELQRSSFLFSGGASHLSFRACLTLPSRRVWICGCLGNASNEQRWNAFQCMYSSLWMCVYTYTRTHTYIHGLLNTKQTAVVEQPSSLPLSSVVC